MKKILLSLFTLAAAAGYGQNNYEFSVSNQAYADLTEATPINNGAVWVFETFGPIEIPFDFSIGTVAIDRFMFEDDNFILLPVGAADENSDAVIYFDTSMAYIKDISAGTGVSGSPISYKVEGVEGSRILKLEVKNAGLEDAENEDDYYLNFQIWMYEEDSTVEYRFGDSNITDASILNEEGGAVFSIATEINWYVLSGDNIEAPFYNEYTEETIPAGFNPLFSSYPVSGTVFRFDPADNTAGVAGFADNKFTVYPNPATETLYTSFDSKGQLDYEIYNMLGVRVAFGTLQNAANGHINVENLTAGMYIFKANGIVK